MGLGVGRSLRLGLEPLPRLARSGRPEWSGGFGTVGPPAAVGDAAATSTAVGAWRSADVEPDRQWLGILEQQNMDSGLTSSPPASWVNQKPSRSVAAGDVAFPGEF